VEFQKIHSSEFSVVSDMAKKYLGVDLPVCLEDLKKAFRKKCLKVHPDQGGSSKEFIELENAYKTVTFFGEVNGGVFICDDVGDSHKNSRTAEGTLLSELGLGLGPTTNGIECDNCSGNGYKEKTHHIYKRCTSCDGGTFVRVYKCNSCSGTGRFTQLKSRRIVDCLKCGGSGKYVHKGTCKICHGDGRLRRNDGCSIYLCNECKGTGEIRIFNPVLQKGALM
jgi:DnaJ family protein A protein 2